MGKTDEKCIFWEGLKNSIFKMAKKIFFLVTKSRCLGEKKGVQFAWAKGSLERIELVHCIQTKGERPRYDGSRVYTSDGQEFCAWWARPLIKKECTNCATV